jgi:integrase
MPTACAFTPRSWIGGCEREAFVSIKIRSYKGRSDALEYEIRCKLPDGTRHHERRKAEGRTEKQQRQWVQDRYDELVRNGVPKPKLEAPTLEGVHGRWLESYCVGERKVRPSTLETYASHFENHLLPVIGNLPLDEIDDVAVGKVRATYQSAASENIGLAILRRLLKDARRWKLIAAIPVDIPRAPRPKTEPAHYSAEEYERLVTAARKEGQAALLLVLLGGEAGLRIGEIRGLEWRDVDFDLGLLTVRRQVVVSLDDQPPKGGRPRAIHLTARLAAELKAARHLRGPRVLCHPNGKRLSRPFLARLLRDACKTAGLTPTTKTHTLRHTFCSRLARVGAPLLEIKEAAGHASVTTTQTYLHLSPNEARSYAGRLDREKAETVKRGRKPK